MQNKNNPNVQYIQLDEERSRRKDDVNMQVVIERISSLHSDVSELRDSTRDWAKDITLAINRLIVLEERQANMNEAYIRVLNDLSKTNSRLLALEQDEPIKRLVSKWVMAGVWAAAASSVLFVAKFVGLI